MAAERTAAAVLEVKEVRYFTFNCYSNCHKNLGIVRSPV